MDPQQEIFTELLVRLKEAGYDVYDGALPPEGTPYPFIYLAESQQTDDANKSAVFGSVYQTVNVWHDNPAKRGTVSKTLLAIKRIAREIESTDNFAWHLRGVNQQVLADETTKKPLIRGILELEFRFS